MQGRSEAQTARLMLKDFLFSSIPYIFSNTDHMPNFGLVPEDMERVQILSLQSGAQTLVKEKE